MLVPADGRRRRALRPRRGERHHRHEALNPLLTLAPALDVQRGLYDIPRGPRRFRAYLDAMTDGRGGLKLPLPLFNPMGSEHVAAMLDRLIRAGAEDTAREALARVADRLPRNELGGAVRVALVVADDTGGGWTDRFLSDEQVRFQGRALRMRGWAVCVLWTGDPPHAHAPERIEAATAEAAYRLAYQRRHGEPRLLRDRVLQEGLAARFGGTPEHRLDPAALSRTAEVMGTHLDSDRFATCFACLYGDDAARRAGHDPLGLSPWAGFAFGAEAVARAGCDPLRALTTGPATTVPMLRGQPGTPVERPPSGPRLNPARPSG